MCEAIKTKALHHLLFNSFGCPGLLHAEESCETVSICCYCRKILLWVGWLIYPTHTFTTLEHQHPLIDISELLNIRRSADYEALKLWMCRSGSYYIPVWPAMDHRVLELLPAFKWRKVIGESFGALSKVLRLICLHKNLSPPQTFSSFLFFREK